MAELNLSEFLKESCINDLNWLDVDEAAYRDLDQLPKQNLDVTPDLKALWNHAGESPSGLVPNTGAPRTMGDLSEFHGRLRARPEDLVRTARLAIMQSVDLSRVKQALVSRYDLDSIRSARTALAGVLAERGLLGGYYVDASDFPSCAKDPRRSADFVRRYASSALYVVAKEACEGCQYRSQMEGNPICGVFHKQIVLDVPYSEEIADRVETLQQAKGLAVQASASAPKERIRLALLAKKSEALPTFSGLPQLTTVLSVVDTDEQLRLATERSRELLAEQQTRVVAERARPILSTLRRELLKGRSLEELAKTLVLTFDKGTLDETKEHWVPLLKESGLYGTVYVTQDSFDSCHEGADFLSRHGSKVKFIVAGDKCSSCIFHKASRCLLYGRKLVQAAEEAYTPEVVQAVLDEHRLSGNLPSNVNYLPWGSSSKEALQAIHVAATGPKLPQGTLRETIERGFYGTTLEARTDYFARQEILKVASRYLNEGLYGTDLLMALKGRFLERDLVAAAADLRPILAEQGLLGIKYIDPTIYDDYGKGCGEAARLHRTRSAVRYAKIGERCASCVHHARPGVCSVLNKQLVVEPPYIDKRAEQQAILSTGRATEVSFESLMQNNLAMMDEYHLQHEASELELNPEVPRLDVAVELGSQKVRL